MSSLGQGEEEQELIIHTLPVLPHHQASALSSFPRRLTTPSSSTSPTAASTASSLTLLMDRELLHFYTIPIERPLPVKSERKLISARSSARRSNIDAGVNIGTIFGIYKVLPGSEGQVSDVLRPGKEMVAAG
jgi:hypothetical protein